MAVSVLDNEDADRRVWLETGIPGLDTILSGGLLQGGLYLVEGHAGTGKTILGFQCGLTYARRRDRVVVVSASGQDFLARRAAVDLGSQVDARERLPLWRGPWGRDGPARLDAPDAPHA